MSERKLLHVAVNITHAATIICKKRHSVSCFGLGTLGGDAQKGGSNEKFFQKFVDKYGYEYFLKNAKSIFENDDITIVNLDGALTSEKSAEPASSSFATRRIT